MKVYDLESHRFADIFPMVQETEHEDLKQDIKEHGLLEPIVMFENKILDGRNRYKACYELGIKPDFKEYDGDKPLEFVISLNLKRRHLTQSQAGVVALDILPLLEAEAKRRMLRGDPREKNPEGGRASEHAGKIFNVNEKYIREAKKLKEVAPELLEDVRLGKKNFSEIKKEQRMAKIKKQREKLQREVLEKPNGLYDVVVIDPPWRYDGDIFPEQKDHLPVYEAEGMRGTTPYPTMSLEEIKQIKLPCKDSAVLWLWTTNSFMLRMSELLEAWGFELKTILTWDKKLIGTGRWLRSQTEHCILAIKGKPYFNNTKWATLISEKRTEHSAKPKIFYEMVNEVCAGRKLDYFARKKREGWDAYGDEVPAEKLG